MMTVNNKEQKYVNELAFVMRKHRSIGSLRLIELVRIAFEKEIGYCPIIKIKSGRRTTRPSS